MKRLTNEEFIKRAKNVHGNKYDYSLVNYINSRTKIDIICKKHGIFKQNPRNHVVKKSNCPLCANELLSKKFSSDVKDFIKKSNIIYNNEYDYSLTNYINCRVKVEIICKKHGVFKQTPVQHLKGTGCIKCNKKKSIGEKIIIKFLNLKNIEFTYQKKFEDCKNKSLLSFDFYLPKYNLLIEYDGIQHYENVDFFGGINMLKKRRENDYIKNIYAINNGMRLLRIPYTLNLYNEIIPTLNFYINKYE